jgi:7-cyano-7-deazaguanine synthase
MTKALVVLSGGQDSTTCLFWALQKFDEVYAISFDYGQRHAIELESARKVAEIAGLAHRHEIVNVKGLLQSTSPLTSDNELEKYDNFEQMEEVIGNRVELTFVPMRNTLFLTVAFNRAVALGCDAVVTGICQADNANYPDCTEVFRHKMELALNCSLSDQHSFIKIKAPLMFMSKAQSVDLACTLPCCMEALAWSHTSYDGKYPPTDNNHSNVLRAKGFEQAGVADPLVIRAWTDGLMDLPETDNYKVYRES